MLGYSFICTIVDIKNFDGLHIIPKVGRDGSDIVKG
ncbi:hypothetical protein bsdtw1_02934 [Clostridium fungisolvens]|uniref:Uncharacterized protein n=1 Tax=Clostridium fungisolvens TaxID=1604897 RepID=A0A6V8SHX0_9CLOT|nr:hypothetical protein bsdtw1_02934 [Clostridium fungisolvens]